MILDGRVVAEKLKASLRIRARNFFEEKGRKPGLAVVLVGDDLASEVYVRNKIRACAETGFESFENRFAHGSSAAQILRSIGKLNDDTRVDAMLVQLPLPPGLDKDQVLSHILPAKDADGLLPQNLGKLMAKQPGPRPCTPAGVMQILDHYQISLKGKEAVVVGRSQIVGLPMALLLQQADCTVTLCHSATKDLRRHTARADIVIAAAGKPKMFTDEDFKSDAVVVDVGIHRLGKDQDGKEILCGDVDYVRTVRKVSALTPVPGGVGPMTIAMLLKNTLDSAEGIFL